MSAVSKGSNPLPSRVSRELGGYKEWPLLEDVELAERLRAIESPAIVPLPTRTSSRRWARLGLMRTTALNQQILRDWRRGADVETLAKEYREVGLK